MHEAIGKFIQNESSEWICWALLYQVRSKTDLQSLKSENKVNYKRNESDRCCGPLVLIWCNGKQILVRHGGTYYRVHICIEWESKKMPLNIPEENNEEIGSSNSENNDPGNTNHSKDGNNIRKNRYGNANNIHRMGTSTDKWFNLENHVD